MKDSPLHTYLAADVAPTGIRTDEFGRLHNQRVSAPAGLPLHEPTDRDADNVHSDRLDACGDPIPPLSHDERRWWEYNEQIARGGVTGAIKLADREQAELRTHFGVAVGRAMRATDEAERLRAQVTALLADVIESENRAEKAEATTARVEVLHARKHQCIGGVVYSETDPCPTLALLRGPEPTEDGAGLEPLGYSEGIAELGYEGDG